MIDELIFKIDYLKKITNRPWGRYYTIEELQEKNKIVLKKKLLVIFSKQKIQLQSHKLKDEYWISNKKFNYLLDGEEYIAEAYTKIFIPKNKIHSIINNSNEVLYIYEEQIGICDEDDVKKY